MLNDLFFVHKGALARFNDVPKNIREVFNYDKWCNCGMVMEEN